MVSLRIKYAVFLLCYYSGVAVYRYNERAVAGLYDMLWLCNVAILFSSLSFFVGSEWVSGCLRCAHPLALPGWAAPWCSWLAQRSLGQPSAGSMSSGAGAGGCVELRVLNQSRAGLPHGLRRGHVQVRMRCWAAARAVVVVWLWFALRARGKVTLPGTSMCSSTLWLVRGHEQPSRVRWWADGGRGRGDAVRDRFLHAVASNVLAGDCGA